MKYTVYILKCADNKPYTGCTDNLEERLLRHEKIRAINEKQTAHPIDYLHRL